MTIEHLTPQSQIDENEKPINIVGCLGNMILVSSDLNGTLDNKSFAVKKQILKDKGINLDPVLLESKEWNVDSIKKRFEYLVKESYQNIWKL